MLDLAAFGPAARCTRILADYGATVVKVGAVPVGGVEPPRAQYYLYSGSRHLRHVAVDLKDPDGRDAFFELVRGADVVVESFRPGVVDRLGIGFEALRAVNPRVILCSTTGYGQDGPRSAWAGHDINYLAVGGYLAATEPAADGGPPVSGATIADAAGGGMHAALAVLAALIGRGPDGPGVHLDVSIADGVLWLESLPVDEYLATGAAVGYGHDVISGRYACYDTYRCADGRWVAVGAIEAKFFANLCRLLGCEQWTARQYDDGVQDAIRADLAAAFATAGPRPLGGRAGRCRHLCQPGADAWPRWPTTTQFRARRTFVEAELPEGARPPGGPVVPPGRARCSPACPAGARRWWPGDPSRSDAEELLGAAGMAPARIAELRTKGVVA